MDTKISARFYRVTPHVTEALDLPDLLLAEQQKTRIERERDVTGEGVTLRIERCEPEGEFVVGDFCRKQVTNLPPQAGPDGLKPTLLPNGEGLGHLAAFRYHRPTRVILLQNNMQCVTPYRAGVYAMMLNAAALYAFSPVLREDALERFKTKKVSSFSVQFASPENLEALDDKDIASARGAKLLAEAFHGMNLTITVSVGKSKKKFLDFTRVNKEVQALLSSDADIKKLRIGSNISDDDDRGIDFLKEHLKCSDTLALEEGDVEKNYGARSVFLRSEFSKKLPYLMQQFGPKK